MNQREKGILEIWERKVVRRIYGGKKEGDRWEKRINNELMQMYDEPSITTVIRKTSLTRTCTKTSRTENNKTSADRRYHREKTKRMTKN